MGECMPNYLQARTYAQFMDIRARPPINQIQSVKKSLLEVFGIHLARIMEPKWLPLTPLPQPHISPTAQAACLMEPAKSDQGGINHDRPDFKPVVPLSQEQKRLPASISLEAFSPRHSPIPEPSGNARPSPSKSFSPSPSTSPRHTPSYLPKGTAPSVIEDWDDTDVNDRFVALHKYLSPLSLESLRQGREEIPSEADEQDQAFLEMALLRSMPQRNPSKTMILKRAMDYILKLELRNERLFQQNIELQNRLAHSVSASTSAALPVGKE